MHYKTYNIRKLLYICNQIVKFDYDGIGGNAGGNRSLGTELRRLITRQGVDRLHAGIDEEYGVGRHHVAFFPQSLFQLLHSAANLHKIRDISISFMQMFRVEYIVGGRPERIKTGVRLIFWGVGAEMSRF